MLAVVAGEDAFAAVVDLVVGGVPVLDDLQAGVDLAAQLRVGLGPPPFVKRRSTWSVSAVRSRSAVAYLTIWS